MRRILAVSVALLVPAVAYAQTQDLQTGPPPPIRTDTVARTEAVRVLPPLKLPNIPLEVRRLQAADRSVAQKQLVASQRVLRFWAGKHAWLLARLHQKCAEVPWQRSCTAARASVRLHTALYDAADHKLIYEIPPTNDWRTAVTLSQRVYPGTESWLLFISHREGGWGGFVMNRQGSGAGGWLQYMASTFYAYVNDARLDLERRGFVAPPGIWVWTNPMGQALTGAYMRFTGRDGHHWDL